MKEAAALVLLVLLWMTYPLVMLIEGMSQAAVRQEQLKEIPYAGTARELYEEHEEILNAAAEILWEHPEFFEQYRVPGENDGRFPLYELRLGREVEHPFTEEEWQTLLALTEQRWLRDVWYYWDVVPAIDFGILTEAEGYSPSLLYIRRAELREDDVRRTMSYHLYIYEAYEWLNADWCVTYYGEP